MDKFTCQICEREIKANTGVIAHHGYQRPDRGSGWQTSSCWGARHLPYEKSCDQIAPYIEHVKEYVENQKLINKELVENPPETITEYIGYPTSRKPEVYPRPEGFDAKKNLEEGSYSYSKSYEYEHRANHSLHKREIETGEREIKRVTARLANWVAPKK
jgi:hypothetical protein